MIETVSMKFVTTMKLGGTSTVQGEFKMDELQPRRAGI